MQQSEEHIIGRQRISVRYRGQADGMALQKEINDLCQNELIAQLEPMFDRFSIADTVIRIDEITIDATIANSRYLKEDLLRIITEKIERALQQAIMDNQGTSREVSAAGRFSELLTFYLQHGYLPWWSPVSEGTRWREMLVTFLEQPATTIFTEELIKVLRPETAKRRLAALITPRQLISRFKELQPGALAQVTGIQQELEVLIRHLQEANHSLFNRERLFIQWKAALIGALIHQGTASTIRQPLASFLRELQVTIEKAGISSLPVIVGSLQLPVIEKELAAMSLTPEVSEKNVSEPLPVIADDESIHTGTAGLVLIALYLPAFFKNLGLIADKQINDRIRAVTLLHYICTGRETFEEFEAALEKICCGVSLHEEILPTYQLTDTEKIQVDELLTAVISHWSALKNTSPGGLQHNFLMREGRIAQQNNQWQLTVKHEAHDILLDFIPWNYRMIKLPWMQQFMTVNWH